jgi:hypothetical protein
MHTIAVEGSELTREQALAYAMSGFVRAMLDAGLKRDEIRDTLNRALHNELVADARSPSSTKELVAEEHNFSVATLNRNCDAEWVEREAEERLRRLLFKVFVDRRYPMTAREALEKVAPSGTAVSDAVVAVDSLVRAGFLARIPRADEAPLYALRGGGDYDVDWGVVDAFDLASHVRASAVSYGAAILAEIDEITGPAFAARLAAHRRARLENRAGAADWPKPEQARALYINEDVPADFDQAELMEALKAELRRVVQSQGANPDHGATKNLRVAVAMHFTKAEST